MSPAELAVSSKYSCCVCEEHFQTVPSLHTHQAYMHSTEELSKAVLSLKGFKLPIEKKKNKLITELWPVVNNLTKCKEFASNLHDKGVDDRQLTINVEFTSFGRPKHIGVVKVIETDSNNFPGKKYPLANDNKDSDRMPDDPNPDKLIPDLQLKSLERQVMDYCENTLDDETVDFDEDPYSICLEDCTWKDDNHKQIQSLWHMTGDERECVMGIMKLQSPDLKAHTPAEKNKRIVKNGSSLSYIINKPEKSNNKTKVEKYCFESSDMSSSVHGCSSLSEHCAPLNNLAGTRFTGLKELKDFKPEEKLGKHDIRKISRTSNHLLSRQTLQESHASETNTKSKLNEEIPIIPVKLTTEPSFSNAKVAHTSQIRSLKFNNSLLNELCISQRNVAEKQLKTVKNDLFPKRVSFQRRKASETTDGSKLTFRLPDEKCLLETHLTGFSDNLLAKESFIDPSDDSFLVKIYPRGMTNRRFFCKPCEKGYTKKSHLVRHLRMHTGERPFPCPHCEKRFAVRSILQQHVRIHTGEKPFSCNICQQRFPQKSGLMTHMMLHTGKPFKCDSCNKAFVSKYKLIQHLRCHNSNTTHACEVCKMLYYTEDALLEHRRVHKEAKQYNCLICKESFVLEIHLKQHLDEHLDSVC